MTVCTAHYIGESYLYEIVTGQIRSHARIVQCNEARIVQSILSQQKNSAVANKKTLEADYKANNQRMGVLERLIEKLYEDRVHGTIPETVFQNLIQKYEEERIERKKAVKDLESRIASLNVESSNAKLWVEQIKRHTDIETLDLETLLQLIDKIVVSEPLRQDGQRVYDIQIVYNYVGGLACLSDEETLPGINVLSGRGRYSKKGVASHG